MQESRLVGKANVDRRDNDRRERRTPTRLATENKLTAFRPSVVSSFLLRTVSPITGAFIDRLTLIRDRGGLSRVTLAEEKESRVADARPPPGGSYFSLTLKPMAIAFCFQIRIRQNGGRRGEHTQHHGRNGEHRRRATSQSQTEVEAEVGEGWDYNGMRRSRSDGRPRISRLARSLNTWRNVNNAGIVCMLANASIRLFVK